MTIAPEQAAWFAETFGLLADNVEQAVLGKRHVVELVLAATLSEGHVLLEDVPGTGKTALARTLGQTVKGTSSITRCLPMIACSTFATMRANSCANQAVSVGVVVTGGVLPGMVRAADR